MEKNYCHGSKINMLATDLDGTLVGSRRALAELNRQIISKMKDFLLVYTTGRIFSSAWQLILEENLLYPDVLITDVGTEIYLGPRFGREQAWEDKMLEDWDPVKTAAVVESAGGLKRQEVHPRFRLSYYAERGSFGETVARLIQAVQEAGLPVKVVPSLNHIIDVVPGKAGKGPALCHLRQMFNMKKENTFVCGDSGNDLSMFLNGFRGIVVGNASRELVDALKHHGEVYFSRAYFASGIMEGLKRYGIL